MSQARKEGESFEEYKRRRKIENDARESRKRMGWLFFKGGTLNYALEREKEEKLQREELVRMTLLHWIFLCILPPAPVVAEEAAHVE